MGPECYEEPNMDEPDLCLENSYGGQVCLSFSDTCHFCLKYHAVPPIRGLDVSHEFLPRESNQFGSVGVPI